MNLISYLFGRNYQQDRIEDPIAIKSALKSYEDMHSKGLQARLIIHRDWRTGILSLQAKEKNAIGFWEKVENFFFGSYDLMNVKTIVERTLQSLTKPTNHEEFQKLQRSVTFLNGPLKARHNVEISATLLQALRPTAPQGPLPATANPSHPLQTIEPTRPSTLPTSIDRVKLQKIKERHADQLQQFEDFARSGQWHLFRPEHSHYDWWAFPIIIDFDNPSAKTREYAVTHEEIQELKKDPEYMTRYRRCIQLVVQSWGWDLEHDCAIPESERHPDQRWTGYGVRLGKMMKSIRFFEEKELFRKLQHFFEEKGRIGLTLPNDGWIFQGFRNPME